MFVNTDAPTKTESEREFALSFETMMGGVKQFLYGIMAAITFSLLLVMGNTMAMTVRERTKEVGTLKALGFKRHTIAGLFLGESILLATIGAGTRNRRGSAALSFDRHESLHTESCIVRAGKRDIDHRVRVVDHRWNYQCGLFDLPGYWSNNSGGSAEH